MVPAIMLRLGLRFSIAITWPATVPVIALEGNRHVTYAGAEPEPMTNLLLSLLVKADVRAGRFRRDLFFRLSVYSIGQSPYQSLTELEIAAGQRTTSGTR